jgi:hypothetical protein
MTLLYLAIGLAALAYLGLPLVIKSTLKINSRPGMNPVSEQFLPSEVQEFVTEVAPKLAALGFERAAMFSVEGSTPNTKPHVALWVNRSAGQWAAANVIATTQGEQPPKIVRYVEFVTRVEDREGTSVTTGNSTELGSFKPLPGHDSVSAPRLKEPATLYKLHQWRESKLLLASAKRAMATPGNELATYAQWFEESIQLQIGAGFLQADASDPTLYTPTLMGAYRMTWDQLPPMKGMKRAASDKRAEEQIRQAIKTSNAPAPMRRAA